GGDRTTALLARVQHAVVDEKPAVVVMLVGINDIWRRFDAGQITTEEQFRENYEKLTNTIAATGAKLVLIEPFLLDIAERKPFRPYVNAFKQVVREVADGKYPLIPMDEIFHGLSHDIPPKTFSEDGIHPTHRGCRYIADLAVKELKKYIV
ncbi:MAG: hypothetical protein K2N74_01470, partial [Clostridiales bacterium]|nr:hypothetical protein [Clostridiales bacterium]